MYFIWNTHFWNTTGSMAVMESAVTFQSTMFSTLASYLLGNQSLSPEAETADAGFRAVDSDDDWVLVEKTGMLGMRTVNI